MNRRQFLKRAGLAVTAITAAGCENAIGFTAGNKGKRPPNVILVMTDDQGYGEVGAHGNKIIKTPNLDKLWTESVRLRDYHVDPTCSPTRSALMTGRYSSRTGVWHTIMGRSLLHEDEITMGDVFKASGYKTGVFGKWHLGDNYPFSPQYRGFEEVLINGGGGVTQLPDYWGNDYFDDTYFHNGKPEKHEGYCTDVWFDGAMKFIEKNRKKPFFCYIPTNAPHGPFYVADEYVDMYRDNPEVPNANFYGMITNIDDNMKRLMDKLEKLDLVDNTILIFTTDNGTAAGYRNGKGFNDGMRGTKGSEYDGGHRVPCFIRYPLGNLTGGRDIDKLCAHIDMLPTLIDICNLKKPDVKFDGKSILPLLTGDPAVKWPARTITVHSQRIETPEKWRKSAVMTERWRFVNGKELYDIQLDPGQQKNVAANHPDIVAQLTREYDLWWDSISERFDGYCEIVLGSKHENSTRLTSHDWHGQSVPWNQGQVKSGMKANGFWAIRIEREGTYRFELRRWPIEVDAPLSAKAQGKAINIKKARLQIADFDQTQEVSTDQKSIIFTAKLKPGSTKMQSWFIEEDGSSRGAYFVYVKRT